MAERRAGVGAELAVAALLLAAATAVRLPLLPSAVVNFDAVGPWFQAWTVLMGGGAIPPSHAPESGPALYWLTLPLLAGAEDLHAAFARRFLLQTLLAPLAFLAVRSAAARSGAPPAAARLGGVVAGGLLALAPGPTTGLVSGYQGYLAVDVGGWIAIAALLALAGRGTAAGARWAAAAAVLLPVAMMCHPMATALALPTAALLAGSFRSGRGWVVGGALAATALGTVRLLQLLEIAGSGAEGAASLSGIATSNAPGTGTAAVLLGSLRDAAVGDGWTAVVGIGTPALVLGAGILRRRRGTIELTAAWVLAAQLGLLAVGGTIGYLQGYHHRILLTGGAIVTGLAAAEAARATLGARLPAAVPLLLAASLLLPWPRGREPAPRPSDLALHRAVADAIAAQADARGDEALWVEFATLGGRQWGSPAAVTIELERGGMDLERLRKPGPLYLVIAAPTEPPEAAASALDPAAGGPVFARLRRDREPGTVAVARFVGPSVSQPWTGGLCGELPAAVERRAGDALRFVRPGYTDEFTRRWFAPCLRGPE